MHVAEKKEERQNRRREEKIGEWRWREEKRGRGR